MLPSRKVNFLIDFSMVYKEQTFGFKGQLNLTELFLANARPSAKRCKFTSSEDYSYPAV